MKIKHILLLILSVSVLASCVQSKLRNHHKSPVKPWTIDLLVTGNPSNPMRVKTAPMLGCFKPNKDGCMFFAHNETGEVTFNLMANDGGFHITELKICMGATPPTDLEEDCPLGVNALEFYVLDSSNVPTIPNPFTGKIEWNYSDNVKSFILFDRNLLKQEYYYLAVACDNLNNCILADPPMDNKGVN